MGYIRFYIYGPECSSKGHDHSLPEGHYIWFFHRFSTGFPQVCGNAVEKSLKAVENSVCLIFAYRYEFSDNFFYYIELKLVNTIRKSLDLYKIYIKSMFTFPPWIASYSLSFPQVFHNVIHLLSTG